MAQPVISLSEVVKDDPAAIPATGRQHDGRRRIRLAGHPGRVEGVGDEEESHDQDHAAGNLVEQIGISTPGKRPSASGTHPHQDQWPLSSSPQLSPS